MITLISELCGRKFLLHEKQEQILSMESIMLIFYLETIINEIIKWNLIICFQNISIAFRQLRFYNILIERRKHLFIFSKEKYLSNLSETLQFGYKLDIYALLHISTKLFIIYYSVETKKFQVSNVSFSTLEPP